MMMINHVIISSSAGWQTLAVVLSVCFDVGCIGNASSW